MSCFLREYASYLNALRFTDMPARDRALTVSDSDNVWRNSDVVARVKRWLYCDGRGMPVYLYVGSQVDCPFVPCYEEIEYEKDLSTLFGTLIVSCSPNLVRRSSSYVVRLFTYISPDASNVGHAIATLTFVCVVMLEEYLLVGITSNCSPSRRGIGQIITLALQAGGES